MERRMEASSDAEIRPSQSRSKRVKASLREACKSAAGDIVNIFDKKFGFLVAPSKCSHKYRCKR